MNQFALFTVLALTAFAPPTPPTASPAKVPPKPAPKLVKKQAPRAEPVIVAPAETKVYIPVRLALSNATKATQARWKINPAPKWQITVPLQTDPKTGDVIEPYGVLFTGPPGIYKIAVLYVDFDAKLFGELDTDVRIVGDVAPVPPGPTPPGPTPPGPTPPPSPAPIPENGYRVLMVYETGDQANYTAGQLNALYSKEIRDYMNSKSPPGLDGKTSEWRIYDKDVVLSGESPIWKAAMARPRTKLPWLIVSNGAAGYEGPMPDKYEDTFAILKQFGGP